MILLLLLTGCLNTNVKEKEKMFSFDYDGSIGGIISSRSSIPEFGGLLPVTTDLGSCLYWQKSNETIFSCHHYSSTSLSSGILDLPSSNLITLNGCSFSEGKFHYLKLGVEGKYLEDSYYSPHMFALDSYGKIVKTFEQANAFGRYCLYDKDEKELLIYGDKRLKGYVLSGNSNSTLSLTKNRDEELERLDCKPRRLKYIGKEEEDLTLIYDSVDSTDCSDIMSEDDWKRIDWEQNDYFAFSDGSNFREKIVKGVKDSVGTASFRKEDKIYIAKAYREENDLVIDLYSKGYRRRISSDPTTIVIDSFDSDYDAFEMKYIKELEILAVFYHQVINEEKRHFFSAFSVDYESNSLIILVSKMRIGFSSSIIKQNKFTSSPFNKMDFLFMKDPNFDNRGKIRFFYTANFSEDYIAFRELFITKEDDSITTTLSSSSTLHVESTVSNVNSTASVSTPNVTSTLNSTSSTNVNTSTTRPLSTNSSTTATSTVSNVNSTDSVSTPNVTSILNSTSSTNFDTSTTRPLSTNSGTTATSYTNSTDSVSTPNVTSTLNSTSSTNFDTSTTRPLSTNSSTTATSTSTTNPDVNGTINSSLSSIATNSSTKSKFTTLQSTTKDFINKTITVVSTSGNEVKVEESYGSSTSSTPIIAGAAAGGLGAIGILACIIKKYCFGSTKELDEVSVQEHIYTNPVFDSANKKETESGYNADMEESDNDNLKRAIAYGKPLHNLEEANTDYASLEGDHKIYGQSGEDIYSKVEEPNSGNAHEYDSRNPIQYSELGPEHRTYDVSTNIYDSLEEEGIIGFGHNADIDLQDKGVSLPGFYGNIGSET